MKVFYRAVHRALVVYRVVRVTICCVEMQRQWGRLLGFGAKDCAASTSREVNFYAAHPQATGFVTEHVAVNFCPFCGRRIEICRVK